MQADQLATRVSETRELLQVLRDLLAFHLVGIRQHIFEGAKLLNQSCRCLGPDLRNAGNAVHAVTHQ